MVGFLSFINGVLSTGMDIDKWNNRLDKWGNLGEG